jgi:hypothetical protein
VRGGVARGGARALAVARAAGEWRPWVFTATEAAQAGLAGSEALRELLETPEEGARWSRVQRRGGARVVSAPHQACAMLPEAAAAMPCPPHPMPLVPWQALGRAAEDSRLVLLARLCGGAFGALAVHRPIRAARFLVRRCASDYADSDRLLFWGI